MQTDGVTYAEIDGDREFEAFDVFAGSRSGKYLVRQPQGDEPEADLILTVRETGETVELVEQ